MRDTGKVDSSFTARGFPKGFPQARTLDSQCGSRLRMRTCSPLISLRMCKKSLFDQMGTHGGCEETLPLPFLSFSGRERVWGLKPETSKTTRVSLRHMCQSGSRKHPISKDWAAVWPDSWARAKQDCVLVLSSKWKGYLHVLFICKQWQGKHGKSKTTFPPRSQTVG